MTDIEQLESLIKAGEAITEKSELITVIIKPKNWFEKLMMKVGLMKRVKVFEISPILVGNRFRVSTVALKISNDIFTDGKVDVNKCWEAIRLHTDDYLYVVAVCIQNNKNEPSKALIEYLRWLPDNQFFRLLNTSLSMAGLPSFMSSTLLIKGSNVLTAPEKDAIPAKEQE
jgi:hypothetical protein